MSEYTKAENKAARVVRRGRPTGYVMSEESKQAISTSKTGYKHTEDTKERISEGVRKQHLTGCPIELLMNTDLSECGVFCCKSGYVNVCIPNPVVGQPTYIQRMHVAIIEKMLGRKLRGTEEIHHRSDKSDNRIHTLSLCKNKKEHKMLERIKNRMDKLINTSLPPVENYRGEVE